MAQIIVSPQAQGDIEEAIGNLGLPSETWVRIGRSLRVLRSFPLAGRALEGRWAPARFVLGPWSWMVLLYFYDEPADTVYVVAVHDARSATSPISVPEADSLPER